MSRIARGGLPGLHVIATCAAVFATTIAHAADNGEARLGNVPQLAWHQTVFRGMWGSFHLSGLTGTAAYIFRGRRYLATLNFAREDRDFRYYSPVGGNASIIEWAFPKQADKCGHHVVWRRAEDGWKPYESTSVWMRSSTTQTYVIDHTNEIQQLRVQVSDLQDRVQKLEAGG